RRRHTISKRDWSSDVCSSDLRPIVRGYSTDSLHDCRDCRRHSCGWVFRFRYASCELVGSSGEPVGSIDWTVLAGVLCCADALLYHHVGGWFDVDRTAWALDLGVVFSVAANCGLRTVYVFYYFFAERILYVAQLFESGWGLYKTTASNRLVGWTSIICRDNSHHWGLDDYVFVLKRSVLRQKMRSVCR